MDDIRVYVIRKGEEYYYSLTSTLKAGYSNLRVADWLRAKKTSDILFAWESMHNDNFNYGEFAAIRNWMVGPGSKNFKLGVKDWIERTNAIGLVASRGRHGGTYGHRDIVLEFAGWVDPLFKGILFDAISRHSNRESLALNGAAEQAQVRGI